MTNDQGWYAYNWHAPRQYERLAPSPPPARGCTCSAPMNLQTDPKYSKGIKNIMNKMPHGIDDNNMGGWYAYSIFLRVAGDLPARRRRVVEVVQGRLRVINQKPDRRRRLERRVRRSIRSAVGVVTRTAVPVSAAVSGRRRGNGRTSVGWFKFNSEPPRNSIFHFPLFICHFPLIHAADGERRKDPMTNGK